MHLDIFCGGLKEIFKYKQIFIIDISWVMNTDPNLKNADPNLKNVDPNLY